MIMKEGAMMSMEEGANIYSRFHRKMFTHGAVENAEI